MFGSSSFQLPATINPAIGSLLSIQKLLAHFMPDTLLRLSLGTQLLAFRALTPNRGLGIQHRCCRTAPLACRFPSPSPNAASLTGARWVGASAVLEANTSTPVIDREWRWGICALDTQSTNPMEVLTALIRPDGPALRQTDNDTEQKNYKDPISALA
ncbi:hypothetical protein BO71DRAFT_431792 [Aspergillus ellipticus CBS 707.79]|uniref:Uncharacterized protein n=1 Tax=Aspergillus ellipticus CBS 707.79 TaxID=1448320 RepID=A0A319ENK1_9EURO|nr:hypothetical protein BO71DRAFT_431792 [Aspergillus ellipticus CBS 707.79]